MKFAAIILVAFALAVGYGTAPVAANKRRDLEAAIAPDVANLLLDGIRNLLTAALKYLFTSINNLLLLIFKALLSLVTLLAPGTTLLPLADLLPPLLALPKPTLATVALALFKLLKVGKEGITILKLVPIPVGETPINLYELLEIAAPFLKGLSIALIDLLNALAIYLGRYFYSLTFP